MDKAKKKLASALDGIRGNLSSSTAKLEALDIKEPLTSRDFNLTKVVRHGFPNDPRAIAYDPVQKLLAIGCGNGAIRIFGKPGVDVYLRHDSESPVLHLKFLVNEGGLISCCKDDTLHLWNFRQKKPEIVHSLQFQKEPISYLHLPVQSKWLYVGTNRGNVHIIAIHKFELSGYVINWNKAIDLSQKNHPGPVKYLGDCPGDENKLLIGFACGTVVLWDLKARQADVRFICHSQVTAISWYYDGRQFVCAHVDGTLSIWKKDAPKQVVQQWAPHSSSAETSCRPITQIEWRHAKNGDEYLVFAGGLPSDENGALPAVTILKGGKSATVLEMEHPIIAFEVLSQSPYTNEQQEPFAVAVLLKQDFLIVDLLTPGYPCFENPYPMDLHESSVTVCQYMTDAPTDIIAAFYSIGSKQKRHGYSEKKWPITGGEWGSSASGDAEIVITGHLDGSLKFWDASSENLQILYKLKAGRHFEKASTSRAPQPPPLSADDAEGDNNASRQAFTQHQRCVVDNLQAITHIQLCPQSRILAAANRAACVTLFNFVRTDAHHEIPVIDISIAYFDEAPGPSHQPLNAALSNNVFESMPTSPAPTLNKPQSQDSQDQSVMASPDDVTSPPTSSKWGYRPLKVRAGQLKRPAGYQPEFVCQVPWHSAFHPDYIHSLVLNTAYGLLAFGSANGVAIVDVVQQKCVFALPTPDLYGAADPFNRSMKHLPIMFDRAESKDDYTIDPHLDQTTSSGHQNSTDCLLTTNSLDSTDQQTSSTLAAPSKRLSKKAPSSPSMTCVVEKTMAKDKDSRSRSSSVSSNPDAVVNEAVTSLQFIQSYASKNEHTEAPCLFVGTSQSSTLVINLFVPTEERGKQNVFAAPSGGSVFRTASNSSTPSGARILCTALLDKVGNLLTGAIETTKIKDQEQKLKNRIVGKRRMRATTSDDQASVSATVNGDIQSPTGDQHLLVTVSEKGARVIGLPSQCSYADVKFDSTGSYYATVEVVSGVACILTAGNNGTILAYSLPSLRPIMSAQLFMNKSEMSYAHATLTMARGGHGIYVCSPTEIQKFTVNADLANSLPEILGDLFMGIEMPEAPKPNIFGAVRSLLGANNTLDREELFGESSGKASRSIARHIPGPSTPLDPAMAQSTSAAAEIARTRQMLQERGEKLSEIEERSAMMAENARVYSSHSSQLVDKMKNKKWYHF